MPKIAAATVKEHHEKMFTALVDAAEDILRERGPESLTAGEVAKKAGIARNSIYRYVHSVDDLRLLVLERYLPQWKDSVAGRVNVEASAIEQIQDLTVASLEMAVNTGHNWLILVMRHGKSDSANSSSAYSSQVVADFHRELGMRLFQLWQEVDASTAEMNSHVNRALLESGMKLLDQGHDFTAVKEAILAAIRGLCSR
ncbi:MAG: TetR/AcrR family transcriptional regulator [Arcanobacterium sp.]|nr:TetR/AcrR family transcriptional regulator [Arcanobacterium sp.]